MARLFRYPRQSPVSGFHKKENMNKTDLQGSAACLK